MSGAFNGNVEMFKDGISSSIEFAPRAVASTNIRPIARSIAITIKATVSPLHFNMPEMKNQYYNPSGNIDIRS